MILKNSLVWQFSEFAHPEATNVCADKDVRACRMYRTAVDYMVGVVYDLLPVASATRQVILYAPLSE